MVGWLVSQPVSLLVETGSNEICKETAVGTEGHLKFLRKEIKFSYCFLICVYGLIVIVNIIIKSPFSFSGRKPAMGNFMF